MNFPLKETVENRKSIRTYLEKPVSEEDKEKIRNFISYLETAPCPFDAKIRINLFDTGKELDLRKTGTYGVIKNATTYLGICAEEKENSMETVGYIFEKLVLYAQSIGLGTCWLGGTFNKSEFASAMGITEDEFFPIASPLGYPAPKNHTINKIMRMAIKADSRKPWSELFFDGSFSVPLTKENAKDFAYALEMVRLAPSAANKQPWRIVKDGNSFHFFEKKDMPPSAHDMQRLDIGIAGCHFELAAKEKNLSGRLTRLDSAPLSENGMIYVFSWISE